MSVMSKFVKSYLINHQRITSNFVISWVLSHDPPKRVSENRTPVIKAVASLAEFEAVVVASVI